MMLCPNENCDGVVGFHKGEPANDEGPYFMCNLCESRWDVGEDSES